MAVREDAMRTRRGRRRRAGTASGFINAAAALAALLVLAGCGGSPGGGSSGRGAPSGSPPGAAPPGTSAAPAPSTPGSAASGSALAPAPGDWPTYHGDALRTGAATGLPAPGTLRTAWTAHLDGAVYGQPIAVRGRLFAATENDTVYALDPVSGRVLWQRHVGTPEPGARLPCGDIDPLGITGTPAYDPATGLVFAVAETAGGRHRLVGLDAATGAVRVDREAEPPRGDRLAHQQRAALAVAGGRVYLAYGGLDGDCAQYIGSVVSAPTSGGGPETSYAVPTPREGGIWAPGGPVVDGGRLLVAVGNGAATSGSYDGSDSVLSLALGSLARKDYFAPASWAQDNAQDADLGSLTPVRIGRYVLQAGKRGTGYLLDAAHLGGVGGQLTQDQLSCRAFGAAAVSGRTAYLPCADGLLRVTVGASGRLAAGWRLPLATPDPPAVGGGAVWIADRGSGRLLAVDPANGRVEQAIRVGDLPHFASPTLYAGRAYLGTLDGVTAVSGV